MAARAVLSTSRLAGLVAAARNCGHRTYSAAAVAAASKEPVNVAGKARLPTAAAAAKQAPRQEDCSWMRDPKTGCWMPENHIDDVDAADLRASLLFSKKE